MHIVVSGGAGFLGSHLCEFLLARGDKVTAIDNLATGLAENVARLSSHRRFTFVQADVLDPYISVEPVDAVAHLAGVASPPDYHRMPLETLAVGSRGTENMLELADKHGARFILASTSEVYGDPLVHPQREDYWGNVNSVGPRSVYDESKRYAEAVSMAYSRTRGTNVGIVRIFNTYGPRMRANDGRVVTTFVAQALLGDPLSIYGDGSQTRSFCYVDDLVRALAAMIDSNQTGPINIGNPVEWTMTELAELVIARTNSSSRIDYFPLPKDDPTRRRPDITRAKELLDWRPTVGLEEGIARTVEWFLGRPAEVAAAREEISGEQFGGQGVQQPELAASA